MSPEVKMRRIIITTLVLLSAVGYALHSLLAREEKASPPNASSVSVAAEDFPLLKDPVDRSDKTRIVSYSDVLEGVNPAVVGVYPSRIVPVSDHSRQLSPLEEMLRRYYGLPFPHGGGGGGEGTGEEQKLPQGMGSGVIVSSDGYILTNNHVITDERGSRADEILVKLSDEREFKAEIVGNDERSDVAVLKIDAENLPSLGMADSENLRVGDIVFAVGNPLGVGLTVTMGIVSATERNNLRILGQEGYENFIQTDASINPGNSGGALVDAEGRLVGINTAILSRSGGNIGIGFAIPVNQARNIMLDLIATGTVKRGFLGVNIADLSRDMAEAFQLENTKGALVQNVVDGLPADQAGLKRGDVILKVDGRSIDSVADLRLTIASTPPGTTVAITVMRDGKEKDFEVTLSNYDNPSGYSMEGGDSILEGVTLQPLTAGPRDEYEIEEDVEGLVLTAVAARSPYSNSLREGMVIIEINDSPALSLSAAQSLLRDGVNKLWVYDHGTYGFIAIRMRRPKN